MLVLSVSKYPIWVGAEESATFTTYKLESPLATYAISFAISSLKASWADIKDEIIKHAKGGELPCAVAFEIAKALKIAAYELGKNADLLNIRLVKCQLGLFGYQPAKKIVKPLSDVDQDLKDAINHSLPDGKLSCKDAWEIAARFEITKVKVSNACEAIKIKIKECQLGAF